MPALEPHYVTILEKVLAEIFVPHLPPLLDKTKPAEEQTRKNLSRAFSAFALQHVCDVTEIVAAQAVVDDYGDSGIDAIYYHAPTETLYLVQGKLKHSAELKQDDALAFTQGLRRLIRQEFAGFNMNIQSRSVDIEYALDNCCRIELIVAHIGSGISKHAQTALGDFLKSEDHIEERFASKIIDYDAARTIHDLQARHACASVVNSGGLRV